MDDLADLAAERLDDTGERGRQLHDRLRRLEFDDGLVDRDLVTRRDEPGDDLGLGQALAEVGQDELAAHASHSQESSAASTRSAVGRWYSSSFGDGNGMSKPAMRSTGAARWWKLRSVTRAATSAP